MNISHLRINLRNYQREKERERETYITQGSPLNLFFYLKIMATGYSITFRKENTINRQVKTIPLWDAVKVISSNQFYGDM